MLLAISSMFTFFSPELLVHWLLQIILDIAKGLCFDCRLYSTACMFQRILHPLKDTTSKTVHYSHTRRGKLSVKVVLAIHILNKIPEVAHLQVDG